jgi:hypothetical protein
MAPRLQPAAGMKTNKSTKSLTLSRETLTGMSPAQLAGARGAILYSPYYTQECQNVALSYVSCTVCMTK